MTTPLLGAGSFTSWQVQLSTGVTVGANSGTGINLTGITGLRDLDGVRSGDAARGQSDGYYPGLNLLGERKTVISWDLTMAPGGVEAALQILAAGFQNVPDPSLVCMTSGDYLRQVAGVGVQNPVSWLQFQLPGRAQPLVLFGRATKYSPPIDIDYQYGKVAVQTEWTSPDGVIYDSIIESGTSGLPSPASGMSWPASWPWTWGASTGGGFSLANPGNYPAYPVFVLQGPLSYPIITNSNTGQSMQLGVTLGASDVMVIDHQAGVVTLNGSANRNGLVLVGSSFFQIQPGNTAIDFSSGDATQVAGTLTGYCLPTYSAV